MRRVSRLSTNFLAGRRSRTLLIVLAVALSTTLVAAVSCALASLNAGMELQVASTVGRADVRIRELGEQRFDASVVSLVQNRPDVALVAPRLRGPVTLENTEKAISLTAVGIGIEPTLEAKLVTPQLGAGRAVQADDEVVLDAYLARELKVDVGDTLRVLRFGPRINLKVVGVTKQPTIEFVHQPGATMSIATLQDITGFEGKVSEVQISLKDESTAPQVAEEIAAQLPEGLIALPTERYTSGIGNTIRANNFVFVLATILSNIAAAFIVLTGLTTSVLERQRELAIMRCIGADRSTLAWAQLMVGAIIGALGAVLGVPLGVFLAWTMTRMFPDRLPAGLHFTALGLGAATLGAIFAGVLGAIWPAINAARAQPLRAMTSHVHAPTRRGVVIVTIVALAGIIAQLAMITFINDGQTLFWTYATFGLPAMFVGYFLLGVPLSLMMTRVIGPIVSTVLRLPRALLPSTMARTPLRNGFTAGALMVGLAMMTSIWTNGQAILRDWVDAIEFPDAFVHGWLGLSTESQERIERLPFVKGTCAITLMKTDSSPFGVQGLRPLKTTFVAFEPDPFFAMTKLHWVAGEPEHARKRLNEGGAVLVAREFFVARPDLHIGDSIDVMHSGKTYPFEIVGVVSSPGLDIVGKSFHIGREQADMAIHSIFGSRADLKRVFHNSAIHLIQIAYKDDVPIDDKVATWQIRAALGGLPMFVGSGRSIKLEILKIGHSSMKIASVISIAAMLIGCLGVVNVVIAGIDARKHEFGVLRAVGAGRSLLARLLIGEVVIIALTSCVLGTLLGLQGSWAGVRLYQLIAGLELNLRPPTEPIALGWGILVMMTLILVLPTIFRVVRLRPRELLGATRG